MAAFKTTLPIRFGDIDHAHILYYPHFYHYFHQAFEDMYPERMNCHYQRVLDDDQIGFPAVHQEMDFFSPVRYGQYVEIKITCETLGEKSVTLCFEMVDQESAELKARCRMVLACLDMNQFCSVPFPQKYRDLFEGIKEGT